MTQDALFGFPALGTSDFPLPSTPQALLPNGAEHDLRQTVEGATRVLNEAFNDADLDSWANSGSVPPRAQASQAAGLTPLIGV